MKKIAEATYEIERRGGMRVPGLVIATEALMGEIEIERPLEQVCNVAHLPGIVGYSIAMPDIHWGYGFPIGGVAAMDLDEGVISPGGVGYDINCGVRLALLPVEFDSLSDKHKEALLNELYRSIPSGVGHGHKGMSLSHKDFRDLVTKGAAWSVERGLGFAEDLQHCESEGCLKGADLDVVSEVAQARGKNQLGTIGSGNHFVEIGKVEHLYLPEVAKSWGVTKGLTYALIHSGSRGFGHQICQDTLDTFVRADLAKGLPDKQLIAAPIKSDYGQNYLKAMRAAANYAFNNRQQILHALRLAVKKTWGLAPQEVRLLYDVCHNIAKVEEHGGRKLCVHRKGATRAYEGQPVLVPGDMGRASHLLVGQANPLTFCSCCHGAGRARSRHQSKKAWAGRDPLRHMETMGVEVRACSMRTIVEEMPDAYKDVDEVVESVELALLAKRVAKLKPHLVLKG